jgi:2-succinyl-6-hydroxy-2,4-cyclohexadiene-1-carboxylate synthase
MAERDARAPEPLILLHGFGGTHRTWDRVIAHLDPQRYRPLALDLPGHGKAAGDRGPTTLTMCVEAVLAAGPERFALGGYSMGGRIALHVALTAPERLTHLILVSSSPGIDDAHARAARRAADRALADELEQDPFELFIERWNAQPLFAGDPREVRELACEDQRRNDPVRLAAALRGMGTGEMASLWGRLQELKMPVTILAGERDARFVALGERMQELAPSGRLRILPGGHRLPLESSRRLAQELSLE